MDRLEAYIDLASRSVFLGRDPGNFVGFDALAIGRRCCGQAALVIQHELRAGVIGILWLGLNRRSTDVQYQLLT